MCTYKLGAGAAPFNKTMADMIVASTTLSYLLQYNLTPKNNLSASYIFNDFASSIPLGREFQTLNLLKEK